MSKKKKSRKAKQNPDYNNIWFSHQSVLGTLESQNAPKSPYYRDELEPLLSKNAEITGWYKSIRKSTIDRTRINQIMLYDINVVCNNKDYHIDHIWITVEKGYMQRNNINQNQKVTCKGYFYEYLSHGTRNIGFRLTNIKSCDKDRKDVL